MPATAPDDDAKMFDLAPVSLWIEDFSAVRALFERWRAAGVTDIRPFLAADPDLVRQCSERIRILKVNRKTLSMFGARDSTRSSRSTPMHLKKPTLWIVNARRRDRADHSTESRSS